MVLIDALFMWFIYAFIGWIMETLYVSIPAGHFVERGFLRGPIIPIYAFGAYLVLYLLLPFGTHPLYIFVFGVIVTSALEYLTSFVLEKLFNMKWWDYTQQRFNIKGRICLKNSILFGILSLVLVLWINPLIVTWTHTVPKNLRIILTLCFLLIAIVDFSMTLASILNLRDRFRKLQIEVEAQTELVLKKGEARLLRIFPNLKTLGNLPSVDDLKHYITDRIKRKKN